MLVFAFRHTYTFKKLKMLDFFPKRTKKFLKSAKKPWYIVPCLPVVVRFCETQRFTDQKLSSSIFHSGRHNLRRFLTTNSTQNYFLIARMLRFL